MAASQGPVAVQAAPAPLSPAYGGDYKAGAVLSSEIELVSSPPVQQWERYLVVSPYTEKEHLLDLDSVDVENQLLAQALTNMTCLREDYATAPYLETFNWEELIESVRTLARKRQHAWKETSFFIVAFRSQIPPTTVYADLGVLDKAAHAEATESGGFLKYWFGTPDVDGRNLATCIWRSRDDARKGGMGPAHRKAAGATRFLYSNWRIDRHRLIIRDNVEAWEMIDWVD